MRDFSRDIEKRADMITDSEGKGKRAMKNSEQKDKKDCCAECEVRFVRHTARTYTGGVEALRLCREKCPENQERNVD